MGGNSAEEEEVMGAKKEFGKTIVWADIRRADNNAIMGRKKGSL